MSTALHRLGRFAARHPWRVIGAWLLVTLAVVGLSSSFGKDLEDSLTAPGLDSQAAVDLLSSVDSDRAGLTAQVVVAPSDVGATFLDSPDAADAVAEVEAAFTALNDVIGVSPTSAAIDAAAASGVIAGPVSADGRVAVIQVQYPVIEELDVGNLEELKELGAELDATTPLQIEMGGELFFSFEQPETGTGEIIGLVVAMIVLLFAFGSVIAMGLPIGMALFGLALGVSAMGLVAFVVEIPTFSPVMASMIGLGVGIDYALFVLSRHRENLACGMTVVEAAGRAVATAGQAVVFAGGTVVIAILGLAVAGLPFMTAAAIGISLVVFIMVVASITLLPAFLGLVGMRVNRRADRRRDVSAPVHLSRRWQRWGSHVSRHAWPYTVGVTILLLALTAPVLALRLGFPDEGTLPESRTERRAYDLVAEGFGPGSNGPLLVAVDLAGDESVVDPLAAAIEDDPGIASVASPAVDGVSDVAVITAIPSTSPQDDATFDTVTRLRSEIFPDVLGDSPARAHVGGQTANFADLGNRVADRLPYLIIAVVTLSFLLLTVVFRSVVVALKAALLNLLSIGAAYGVLVMVFQWGWGAGLIGLEGTVPIVSFVPMMMFAVLFGLSMDYEVFLLSRVREEYVRTGDNDAAVIRGLSGTARVISSAALIMVSVFSGFVLGEDPVIKMMGLGLAVAILVDASVVRMVLVPASMTLMGDANWWLPERLDRHLPHIDLDGAAEVVPQEEPELVDVEEVREPALID